MKLTKTSIEKGAEAEEAAARYYQADGYRVLARNFRLAMGELDLVVEREGEVVIVEVKGRKEFREWEAESPLWRRKKRSLRRTTEVFLERHENMLPPLYSVRLDIVYVTQGRVSEVFMGEPFV
jgi:putative endonuclease